jgi:peptide/nickel transport system substrate-binding protein
LRRKSFLRLFAVLAALLIIAAACGGNGDDTSGGGTNQGGEITPGGVLRLAGESDVDYMDPVATYYTVGFFLHYGVSRTLMSFPTGGGPEVQGVPIPDLASGEPEHNDDFTEWTFHMKDGIKFGPALGGEDVPGVTGEEITSQDIAYAVKRIFMPSTGAQYGFYYDAIEGSDQAKKGGELSGVETPDDKTIVFHLTESTGDWPSRMALPATAPVPESYASKFDKEKDSDYDHHVVASGPYYIADWKEGELIDLKKNPEWDSATDENRPAYVDEMYWKIGFENNVGVQKVLDGDYDMAMDVAPLGPALKRVVTDPELNQRFVNEADNCTSYIYMNVKVPPFDDVNVRQAVNLAIDKDALRQISGGEIVGDISTSILPPGIAGYLSPDEYDPYNTPNYQGDIAAAKEKLAGTAAEGGWDKPIIVVGASDDPSPEHLEVVRKNLEELGFSNVETKQPAYPNNYTQFYQVPESNTAVGTASGWCQDYADAYTYFFPLFHGDNVIPTGSNYSQLDDPDLNAAIEEAAATPPGDERTEKWKEVNKMATELAAWVPRLWTKTKIIYSPTITGEPQFSYFFGHVDWTALGVNTG